MTTTQPNILFLFAGDNGLAVGQHGLMGKQNLYEHSIRAPLIFRGPGIPAGVKTNSLCYLLDIFPTLCDFLDIPVPDSVDGKSLRPAINTPGHVLRETQYYGYCSCQRAVRDSQYKLIENLGRNKVRTTQLFDVKADPYELYDLSIDPEHSEFVEELRQELMRWRQITGDTRDNEHIFWDHFSD